MFSTWIILFWKTCEFYFISTLSHKAQYYYCRLKLVHVEKLLWFFNIKRQHFQVKIYYFAFINLIKALQNIEIDFESFKVFWKKCFQFVSHVCEQWINDGDNKLLFLCVWKFYMGMAVFVKLVCLFILYGRKTASRHNTTFNLIHFVSMQAWFVGITICVKWCNKSK